MEMDLSPEGFLIIFLTFLLQEWYCSISGTEMCALLSQYTYSSIAQKPNLYAMVKEITL